MKFEAALVAVGLKASLIYEKLSRLGELAECDPRPESFDEIERLDCLRFRLITDQPWTRSRTACGSRACWRRASPRWIPLPPAAEQAAGSGKRASSECRPNTVENHLDPMAAQRSPTSDATLNRVPATPALVAPRNPDPARPSLERLQPLPHRSGIVRQAGCRRRSPHCRHRATADRDRPR